MQIDLTSVSKNYGAFFALKDVTLTIPRGQIVALLGPNGAGKTTLMRCLSGISVPDRGEIRYDETLFTRDEMELRKRFFFLPDFPFVYPEMTVIRHIGMVLKIYGADTPDAAEKVVALLKDFDLLTHIDAPLGGLSRGEAYKAGLVAFLACDPDVWMLDEPFASGMDPHGLMSFKQRAKDAAARGRTVLYSTQILDVAETFSDQVCVIHKGIVRAFGSVASLKSEGSGDGRVLEELFEKLRAEGHR